MTEDLARLAQTLRQARRALSLSATEAARKAGISRPYLWVLEGGRNPKTKKPSRPSLDVLNRVASVLNLDVQQLAPLAGYPPTEQDVVSFEITSLRPRADLRPGRLAYADHVLVIAADPSSLSSLVDSLRVDPQLSVALWDDAPRRLLRDSELPESWLRLPRREWREAFTRRRIVELVKAGFREGDQMEGTRPAVLLDVVAGSYVVAIPNPGTVLAYERQCCFDFQSIFSSAGRVLRAVVCVYREHDVRSLTRHASNDLRVLTSLLESHDRILHVDREGHLVGGQDAVLRTVHSFARSLVASPQTLEAFVEASRRLSGDLTGRAVM